MTEAVIVATARSPIGRAAKGSLVDLRPDDMAAQVVSALMEKVPEVSADDVTGFCKGQIAHYKIPRYIRLVEEFPMTVTGKIQKFVMRDSMVEELGLAFDETA